MKKLLLILTTVFVSVMGWAATKKTLNPYAYDLKTESWDPITQKLTISFKLNAAPNIDTSIPNNERGIQIFALDPSNPNDLYCIYGVPGADIQNNSTQEYHCTITIDGMSKENEVEKRRPLPTDKKLTWAVRVQGLNRDNAGTPVVIEDNIDERPYSCHGIAVNNDQNSDNFGSIYVTEASNGIQNHATWGWLYNKGKSLLKYSPRLEFEASYQKASHFSDRNVGACLLEPHRVRVSDDGRIFVSSYNRNTNTSQIDVWEFKNGTYTPLIYHKTDYGHRLIGMDVKGSGTNVTLLLCFLKETADLENGRDTKFRLYEYNVNTKTMTHVTDYANGNSETSIKAEDGTSISVNYQRGLTNIIKEKYYFYSDGLSSVTYGANKANNNFYWGADYFYNTAYTTRLVYYKRNDINNPSYFNKCEKGHYYGGAGMVSYIEQGTNRELIVMGRCQTGVGTDENKGRLQVYHNNNGTISATPIYSITTNSRTLINDVTIDPAYNLYAVSFTDGTTGSGTGRLIAIAMPYSGTTTTIAPNNDGNKFQFLPVPNILATDLRCEPHATQNKYIFSFNTNTKPEEAQIRFYESYDAMKNSLNVVNADNYNGTNANKPAFVYNIPDGKLKQGRIEVELGGVCGKLDANNVIINDSLPAGVLYWSVYVKTRESRAFAPIYEQSTTGEDAHNRLHATVNNYPETDGFGHIYAVNYYAEFDARNGLMEYSFNPNGKSNDEQNNIKNSNRYKLVENYLNPSGNKPKFTNQRRLDVAPDGKVYIADAGQSYPFDANAPRPWMFTGGGVFVWNPNTQTGNEIQISQFLLDQTETSTGVAIYNHNGQLKLYATNTYGEFDNHYNGGKKWKGYEYSEANQADVSIYGWNGFKDYVLGTPNNVLMTETSGTELRSLGMGDGNGHISLVAMEKGVWMAQHRLNDVQYTIDEFNKNNSKKPALPDNTENYVLSFVPYGSNTRTWRSCTSRGINYSGSTYDQKDASELTQLTSSPLQSCPGAGLAYRKTNGKEYLYIVNHQGNIVELQITSWSGTTPTVKYIKTYPGSGPKGLNDGNRTQGAINSMCFDYAGNLITTSGEKYIGATQNILVYTMPYDRVNAREIQAPNSCRMIPERVAHSDMGASELDLVIRGHQGQEGCAIDLYRPLQGGMFNTICLPFELNIGTLPADHPLKDATLRAYTGLNLNTIGGEKVLELVFADVNDNIIRANTPYIIRPENDEGINHIIRFDGPLVLTDTTGIAVQNTEAGGTYSITYRGIIPYQYVEPKKLNGESLTLMLVADNRLATMTSAGDMYGFRGYFTLNQPLPKGMQTRITNSKGTTTNTTIVVDGKKVNVEKYLREGRVYIRVGDSLYTITGEKVE